ncbi:hypothetical protein ACFL47_03920 [Candidatus Latescibacterota bacterium]
MAKTILLLSGGLDSTLAGKLMIEMGIEVEAFNLVSPFCKCTPHSLGCSAAAKAADQLGIPVHIHASGEEYLEIIKHPRFGRGSGMNPCIDCRIYSFKKAHDYMIEKGADFITTGEVLGERPMSQRRDAMARIEKESGLSGLILRPLSAKLMEPSKPEIDGLVDRNQLLDISGRRRTPQFELAEKLGIRDFLCPAGGCMLTDPEFAPRLSDLLEHEPGFGMRDANLLKYGRHFRLPSGAKIIVGRTEKDNDAIERFAGDNDVLLMPVEVAGPTVLGRGLTSTEDRATAASFMATYTKGGTTLDVEIRHDPDGTAGHIIKDCQPLDRDMIAEWIITSATWKKSLSQNAH